MSKAKGKKSEKAPIPPPPIVFDEFNSEASLVNSVIILMQSSEEPIVLKALYHIDSYASKYADNIKIVYDVGLLNAVLPHLDSNHRFVRRFAMKLAAALFKIDEACCDLRKNDRMFSEAVRNYVTVSVINKVKY